MKIDLKKIPRDKPIAVHIPSKEHGKAFLDAMKEQYPQAVSTWTRPFYEKSREKSGGNYYYPRLHTDNPYMTHGGRNTYSMLGVEMIEFDRVLDRPNVELETSLGDVSLDLLFGGV